MASAAKTKIPLVFGAMTFGKTGVEQTRVHDLKTCGAMLDLFQKHGHKEVDTARVYGQGSSEEYLGELKWQDRGIVMETKLYPTSGKITHSSSDLRKFLNESLKALKADKIDMWYLHGPDRKVPYEETFKAVNDLYKEGLFARFGLSNYMNWEIAYINEICIQNGWIRPSVYQGVYNAIHRTVEAELFPCLRHYKMAFYAYNPLAGGYLTSRYQREKLSSNIEDGSRFDPKTNQGKLYQKRYMNDIMFDALDIVREVGKKFGLTETEMAFRWEMHHSLLRKELGDTIIIGASSLKHLEENLVDAEKGPLPEEVVEALDRAWAVAKPAAWNYYH